jgi:multidrug efflux pump subunit AcrA (membrane-fusion protein)
MVKPGNLVTANGTQLMTIQQLEPIFVTFAVPAMHLSTIKQHMSATPMAVTVRGEDATTPIAPQGAMPQGGGRPRGGAPQGDAAPADSPQHSGGPGGAGRGVAGQGGPAANGSRQPGADPARAARNGQAGPGAGGGRAAGGFGPPPSAPTPSGTVGRLTFIDNAVDPTTDTIKLKASFPNIDRQLWPGQFARVSLRLTTLSKAVVVPTEAIQTGQEGQYVFVVKQDTTVEQRPVTTGERVGLETVIQAGLHPGETVVTEGQLRLEPGVKVQTREGQGGPGGRRGAGQGQRPRGEGGASRGGAGRGTS